MAAAMGGRAAEEIIFGDVTTGAKQDIEAATSIARQMVCEFGMSERLGLVTLHRKGDGDNLFFSELTAADVDAEIKALTDAAYRQASDICTARRATLVRIAEHLQQVETINGDELDALLAESERPLQGRMLPRQSRGAAQIAAASVEVATAGLEDTGRDEQDTEEVAPPVAAG